MHYGDMDSWGWSMMFFGALVWIGFLAVFAAIAWAAIRPRRRESATPLDLLEERYARGQITHDEFEQTRKDLVHSR